MSHKQWCFNEVLKNTPAQGAEFVCNHERQQSSVHDKAACVSMIVFLMGTLLDVLSSCLSIYA